MYGCICEDEDKTHAEKVSIGEAKKIIFLYLNVTTVLIEIGYTLNAIHMTTLKRSPDILYEIIF